MFKLKLWLTPLLCLLTGSALLFVGTTAVQAVLLPLYEEQLQVSRVGLRGIVKGDVADAITAAVALTDKPDVRQLFGLQGDATQPATDLLAKPEGRLSPPAFALFADATGKIVKTAGEAPGLSESIAGLPVFAEAMTGVLRDGFLRLGGAPFMIVGAPVVKDRASVGVVVLGFPLDGAFADAISRDVGKGVALVDGQTKLGAALAELAADDLKLAIAEDTVGELALDLPVPLPLPLFVENPKRYAVGAVPLYPGTGGPSLVLAVDRNEAMQLLAYMQLYVAVATLLLSLLLSTLVLSILSSISRPMNVLLDHLGQFAQGGQVGILPEAALAGPFVRLGKQINMILQNAGSAGPRPGTPPISPIGAMGAGGFGTPDGGQAPLFGAAPATNPTSDDDLQFEGIPGLDSGNAPPLSGGFALAGATPSTPPSSTPTAGMGLPGMGLPGASKASMPPLPGDAYSTPSPAAPGDGDALATGLSGLFDDAGPDPLAAFRVGNQPAGAAPAPPAAPPANPYNPDATVMFQVPQELIQESAAVSQSGGPLPSGPPRAAPPVDERTVVAQVPAELINKSAAPLGSVPSADEQHYRQVFQEFLDVRRQCGEDTDQLTYEKFLQKLMKNREQIIEKYHSKSVRFQVYVKQGKAALRAVPVRD